MIIEKKFDPLHSKVEHLWIGGDAANEVFLIRMKDKKNGKERYFWPGDAIDREVPDVDDLPWHIKRFLYWCRKALLETENMVISAEAKLVEEETGMDPVDVKDAMVQVSKMQHAEDGMEGDGDWMTWHDQDNWDADIYPQLLVEFTWSLPKVEELTDDDLDAINTFHEDLTEFIVSHAIGGVDKTEDDIRWLVDRAEFVALLADEICEFCADRGVDLHYPEQVTDTFTGDQKVNQCTEPNSYAERDKWLDMLKNRDNKEGD